jgi:hypothetical protein
MALYSRQDFRDNGIELLFLKPKTINYQQFKNEFIANLSILDVIMFSSKEQIKEFLNQYEVL